MYGNKAAVFVLLSLTVLGCGNSHVGHAGTAGFNGKYSQEYGLIDPYSVKYEDLGNGTFRVRGVTNRNVTVKFDSKYVPGTDTVSIENLEVRNALIE